MLMEHSSRAYLLVPRNQCLGRAYKCTEVQDILYSVLSRIATIMKIFVQTFLEVTCYFNLWILKIVSSPGFPAVNSASLFPQFRLLGRHSFVLIFDTTNQSKFISLSVIQYDVIGKKNGDWTMHERVVVLTSCL